MELEIRNIPPLNPAEISLVETHSLLNILNVLKGELSLIGLQIAGDSDLLREGHAVCDHITATFRDPTAALEFAARVKETEDALLAEISNAMAHHPELSADSELQESLANIRSVFQILDVRAAELLARANEPARWMDFPIAALQADFRAVFAAIEKNSHGRYHIIYNPALQQSTDYYVDFVVESTAGATVRIPMVFKDVMRDLAANARKYTAPGGTITMGVFESADELRFVIQDTGCGIPAAEIEQVVAYGHRGSNVQHVRTMGGGFGLTKAFLVTKRFGGRFWIKSEVGEGTRITISIPRKTALAA